MSRDDTPAAGAPVDLTRFPEIIVVAW